MPNNLVITTDPQGLTAWMRAVDAVLLDLQKRIAILERNVNQK